VERVLGDLGLLKAPSGSTGWMQGRWGVDGYGKGNGDVPPSIE